MKHIYLMVAALMMAVGSVSAQDTTKAQVEGTTVTVKGQGIYCGEVDMKLTQTADGTNYLYDSDRKISVLIGATMPSLDSLAAKGQFCDYFPDCGEHGSIDNYINIIVNKKRNDGYHVDLTNLMQLAQIPASKGTFNGYKLKNITITQMTAAGGKDYMPSASAPLMALHVAFYHLQNEWSVLFEHTYPTRVV